MSNVALIIDNIVEILAIETGLRIKGVRKRNFTELA